MKNKFRACADEGSVNPPITNEKPLVSALTEICDGVEALKLQVEALLPYGDAGRPLTWMIRALEKQVWKAAELADEAEPDERVAA